MPSASYSSGPIRLAPPSPRVSVNNPVLTPCWRASQVSNAPSSSSGCAVVCSTVAVERKRSNAPYAAAAPLFAAGSCPGAWAEGKVEAAHTKQHITTRKANLLMVSSSKNVRQTKEVYGKRLLLQTSGRQPCHNITIERQREDDRRQAGDKAAGD